MKHYAVARARCKVPTCYKFTRKGLGTCLDHKNLASTRIGNSGADRKAPPRRHAAGHRVCRTPKCRKWARNGLDTCLDHTATPSSPPPAKRPRPGRDATEDMGGSVDGNKSHVSYPLSPGDESPGLILNPLEGKGPPPPPTDFPESAEIPPLFSLLVASNHSAPFSDI